MATVINTPAREAGDGGAAAGWAVAVIVLVAVGLVALFVWPGYVRTSAPTNTTPGANINVTLPSGSTESGSNTGGSDASGGSQTTPGSGSTIPAQ